VASRERVGVSISPPKVLGCPKPASSNMTMRMLGASSGRRRGSSRHLWTDSCIVGPTFPPIGGWGKGSTPLPPSSDSVGVVGAQPIRRERSAAQTAILVVQSLAALEVVLIPVSWSLQSCVPRTRGTTAADVPVPEIRAVLRVPRSLLSPGHLSTNFGTSRERRLEEGPKELSRPTLEYRGAQARPAEPGGGDQGPECVTGGITRRDVAFVRTPSGVAVTAFGSPRPGPEVLRWRGVGRRPPTTRANAIQSRR
jgi:hypothetical protein